MLATVKIAEGENGLSVYAPEQTLQSNTVSYEEVAIFTKSYKASEKEAIKAYIREVFGADAEAALRIAQCESGFNPNAYNPETIAVNKGITKYGSYGIFQINSPYDERLYDYQYNTDRAYELFEARGWNPWLNCKNKLAL